MQTKILESKLWQVNSEKTNDHWLELLDCELADLDKNSVWSRAEIRLDGCIHYHEYGNLPYLLDPERKDEGCCDDYIHICNIDDHIKRLQDLRDIAREHFGEDWGKSAHLVKVKNT